ncbi:MAG: glycosyltransferase family 39 protein [Candidatus Sumerlaeaceae bacterium]|nr:glycosyltransferase family 39 protein [Candidatus Sumerlaeaceae bacterium]
MTDGSQLATPALNNRIVSKRAPIQIISALLLIFAAALYLTRLGATPLRVNAEIRTYEITKNMLEHGDYIVPVFRAQTRFNKPPLYYWSSIGVSRLLKRFDLQVHRIPSVVAALGVLALGLAWGHLLGKKHEVVLGLSLLAVSYLFVVQGRRGSFETMLAFFCNASLLSFYLSYIRRSFCWAMLGGILFGLAFLTKGTPALLYVPLVFSIWLLSQGQFRKIWRREMLAVALVGVGIAISWHVYILIFLPDSRSDIVSEVFLPFGIKATEHTTAEHREPFYFYLMDVWRSGFPLSLFIPLAIAYIAKNRLFEPHSPQRLLALSIFVPLVVFSAIPMKQDHYLLPSFLPLALLTGEAIGDMIHGVVPLSRKWLSIPLAIGAVLIFLAGIAVAAGTYLVFDAMLVGVVLGIALLACSIGIWWSVLRGRWTASMATLALGTWLLFGWYFVAVRPIEDGFGSGTLLVSADYDAAYWNKKFERYPLLKKLLDAERGERIVSKSKKRMGQEFTSATITSNVLEDEASAN